MTSKELFQSWAPTTLPWSNWVKPPIFMSLKSETSFNYELPKINYLSEIITNYAIIVDLANVDSVLTGLALGKLGYQPVPLYNGTFPQNGARALVDLDIIQDALRWGKTIFDNLALDKNSPPAFLIDSQRIFRYKMEAGLFDNSWDIYPQDLPSPNYLKQKGIDSILVHTYELNRDLKRVLYNIQQKGLKILSTNGFEIPKEIKFSKPPKKDKFH